MGSLLATFLLGLATLLLMFWYSLRKQKYWKEKGIPYVKPLPFIGSFYEYMKKPFQILDIDRHQKYGRLYGYYEGNQALLSLAEPEILRNIFVKDFHKFSGRRDVQTGHKVMDNTLLCLRGEKWKRIRATVSPTFTTGKLKRMMSIFNDCSETLLKSFREASKKGEPIDAKNLYSAFTMDTIASAAFSTKIDSHNDPNNKFVSAAKQIFSRKLNLRLIIFAFLFMVCPRILKIIRLDFLPPSVSDFFIQTVLQIIEERKRTGQTRNDFLQLLIDTTKEAADERKLEMNENDDIADNYGKTDNNQIFKGTFRKMLSNNSLRSDSDSRVNPMCYKCNLSPEELVPQCIMFFIAGFDTTTATLSFISYMLALHTDVQERIIQEVDKSLEASDGEMTYEALQGMKYLDNTIAETLRLFPPVPRLERLADVNYELGDTGLTIPKGMIITVPIYAMHRDPALFQNPEKFDPDRFSPEERSKQVPYSYMPFGVGPRSCVGMRFALMNIKTCLAHVLKNFRIKKCASTQVPLEYDHVLGFLQPKSVSLFMEKRKDSKITL